VPLDVTPDMAVHIHTLDNGLCVYLAENHDEPWISCRVAVRAGAAQEPVEATGLAHYLEHMLANKGSRALGTRNAEAERPLLDQIRALYEQLRKHELGSPQRAATLAEIDGVNQRANHWAIANELKQAYGLLGARRLNASTSHDRTVYTVDIPSNRLPAWALLEGDRFSAPVFRGFPTELETIVEEKNRALDNPSRVLHRATMGLLWAGHPYARDVLGEVAHLLCPSILETERFFARWYVPNNMAVILVGDLDPAAALTLVEDNFGGLEARELPAYTSPVPALSSGTQQVQIQHHGDPELRLVWRTVPRSHEDAEALILADMMLNNSSTGLLDTRLTQRQKVRGAGSFPGMRVQGGTQTVWGRPRIDQSLDEVEALLREQVQALCEGDFRDDDLEALIANFEVGELRRLESNQAQAALMIDAFVHGHSWPAVRGRVARLATLGREQVSDAARRWLGEDLVVARRVEGDPEVTKIPVFGLSELELDDSSRSALFQRATTLPGPKLEVQVLAQDQHYTLETTSQGRIYRAANPNNDLFQLTVRRELGSAHDPVLAKALALWGQAGVGELDLEGYRRALFHEAAGMAVDCRRQQTDISLAGRACSLPRILPLIRARLSAPVLSDQVRRRWAEDLVGKRKQRIETAGFKFQALKQWALRGPDSPYLAEALSNKAVLDLGLDALRSAPGQLRQVEQTVFYAGPHSREEVYALLGLDSADTLAPALAPAYRAQRYTSHSGTRIYVIDHEAAQTQIGLYLPARRFDSADSALYRLFQDYMGGPAGLVFQELRESRGLAYTAQGGFGSGARLGDDNLVWARAASRPDRTAEAVTLLLDLYRSFPAQTQRFERAQASAIEKLIGTRIRFRGFGLTAEAWRLRGLEGDPRPQVLAALRELDLDALSSFAAPLANAGAAVVLAGDTRHMDMDALARLGDIELLTLDDLVAY